MDVTAALIALAVGFGDGRRALRLTPDRRLTADSTQSTGPDR
jgi:hypothetical protein